MAVFRPSDGAWYILGASTGFQSHELSFSDARLEPGDYDGDNKDDYSGDRRADPAVQRPSNGTFYILDTATGGTSQVDSFSSDFPVAAAYLTPLY